MLADRNATAAATVPDWSSQLFWARSQPLRSLEPKVEDAAENADHPEYDEVAVLCLQLGHVVEVHTVYSGYSGGDREYRCPSRELPGDYALPLLLQQIAGLEHGHHHFAQASQRGAHPVHVIEDVAEERLGFLIEAWEVEMHELARDFCGRAEDPLEKDDLTPQSEQPPDLLPLKERHKHVLLHGKYVVLYLLDDRQISVYDKIDHRMKDIVRALFEKLRRGLRLRTQIGMCAGGPQPDGDNMVLTDEYRCLPVTDLVAFELGGFNADENLASEHFDFGHLLEIERVLDGERMKPEVLLDERNLVAVRFVQADPDELTLSIRWTRVCEINFVGPLSVFVAVGCNYRHLDLL